MTPLTRTPLRQTVETQITPLAPPKETPFKQTVETQMTPLAPPKETRTPETLLTPTPLKKDISSSSSGSSNSSYGSTSERFVAVTPRRPLHDSSHTPHTVSPKEGACPAVFLSPTELEESSSEDFCSPLADLPRSETYRERFNFLAMNSELYEKQIREEALGALQEEVGDIQVKSPSRATSNILFTYGDFQTGMAASQEQEEGAKQMESSPCLPVEGSHSENPSNEPPKETMEGKKKEASVRKGSTKEMCETPISQVKETVTKPKSTFKFSVKKSAPSTKTSSTVPKKSTSKSATKLPPTPKSVKKGNKSQVAQKLEFSFSVPYSPAGPEILEALSSPPQMPVPTFLFSPPATRARVRQKKLNETLGSSFSSVASEMSFSKKPPIDPLLEGIMFENAPETRRVLKTSTKKKMSTKKTKPPSSYASTAQDSLINLLSPTPEDDALAQPSSYSSRHSMVLRQTKKKKKSVKLF